jgi:hypothetical protein
LFSQFNRNYSQRGYIVVILCKTACLEVFHNAVVMTFAKACSFKRRASHVPNALKTIDNQLKCIRHMRSTTFEAGLILILEEKRMTTVFRIGLYIVRLCCGVVTCSKYVANIVAMLAQRHITVLSCFFRK